MFDRNGNSNVKYKQAETLKRAYGVLAEFGIKVKHSRMDCGSFDKTVIPVVEANSTYFYIRAQRCENLYDQIGEISRWETVTIGMKDYEAASIEYAPFGGEKTYRYVIAREKNRDGQGNLFTGDDFTYRAIMTNNEEMSDKWEWNDSECSNGQNRWCVIHGGSFYNPSGSVHFINHYASGGPMEPKMGSKYMLMWSGLDRCSTIGFRCVVDVLSK